MRYTFIQVLFLLFVPLEWCWFIHAKRDLECIQMESSFILCLHCVLSPSHFSLTAFPISLSKHAMIFFSSKSLENGMNCRSFGWIDDTCTLESTIMVFFIFSFLGWNFVWLYDLIKVFKQPMHTTDQLMFFYVLFAYIPAIIIACAFYYFRKKAYIMVSSLSLTM